MKTEIDENSWVVIVQPTEVEGAPSERPSEAQPTPSPPHPSVATVDPQSDPSPRPSPSTTIPDSIPESSGRNHGGQSYSDKSLSGNGGDMTLQSVYDLCISLCTQVSDQAKEIQHFKAQIKKLKKQAKPVITHHRAWMKSVSLKQSFTEDVLSTAQQKVSTDKEKVSTDRPIVSTDESKIDPKDKGKKKIEEDDESESESDGILEAEKKFKQLASDEEMARKARIEADRLLAEKLQEEEREQFTIEERAKFLHDTIAHAVLKENSCFNKIREAIRDIHLQRKQLRNQNMTMKQIKRSDEDFISIGSAEDERLIKKMNEKGIDSSKNESVKEEDKEEEGTKKRKGGHIKMIARKKKRSQSDVDSDDEHKKCLKIVTFCEYLDRAEWEFPAFNYLDGEVTLDGFALILWGDLKIMMESSTEGNEQSDFWSGQQDWKIVTWRLYESCGVCILEFEDGIVIHILVERRYPLSKDLLQRMLDLGLEVERESSVALDLIRFIKQQIDKE
ncbi:hypothetical protein Tco_0053138 [Tanacetum coccineum]